MKTPKSNLNPTERAMIEKRAADAYNFIRVQNRLPKAQRDARGVVNSKRVLETCGRWLNS
jgi:hypothetical protein